MTVASRVILYFPSGVFCEGGRDGFVVVKNDAVKTIVRQILKLGRSLGADGIIQHASVGGRMVEGFGGTGGAPVCEMSRSDQGKLPHARGKLFHCLSRRNCSALAAE